MDGLRIFIDPPEGEPPDTVRVFYSRRGTGPLYRWSFAETPKRWRGKRVNTADLTTRELSLSKWKDVPPPLQKTMSEHYQE